MPSTDSKRPEAISVDSPESVSNGGTAKCEFRASDNKVLGILYRNFETHTYYPC